MNALERLVKSGYVPQNANYALKVAYVIPVIQTIDGLTGKLASPSDEDRDFRDVQRSVEDAVVSVRFDTIETPQGAITQTSKGETPDMETTPVKVAGTPRAIGETVEFSLRAFLRAHLKTIQGNDASLWAGMFSNSVDYCYTESLANRKALARDRQELINKYPNRSYEFQELNFKELDGGSEALISFTYTYRYQGRSRQRKGACRETIRLKWAGDRWLITGYDEEIEKSP